MIFLRSKAIASHTFLKLTASLLAGLLISLTSWALDPIPAPPNIAAEAYILEDFHSGRVLAEKNADMKLPPASLTKMMTAYVAFRALDSGQLTLEETIKVSRRADAQIGSMMAIREGDVVNTEQLIKGVLIMSGNDSAVALAELVAGTEESFADLMNQTAQQLGMQNTYFINASGLPAADTPAEDVKLHFSTARDLSRLAKAIIRDFPQYYPWFALKEYGYQCRRCNEPYTRQNRNSLLFDDPTVDGIKTGHTAAAGYCLISSANRNGMRLLSTVLGTSTKKARAETSSQLLRYGYRFYETRTYLTALEPVENIRVWYGEEESVTVAPADNVYLTFPRGSADELKLKLKLNGQVEAPVTAQQDVGELIINLDGETLATVKAVALNDVATGSVWDQFVDWLDMSASE